MFFIHFENTCGIPEKEHVLEERMENIIINLYQVTGTFLGDPLASQEQRKRCNCTRAPSSS